MNRCNLGRRFRQCYEVELCTVTDEDRAGGAGDGAGGGAAGGGDGGGAAAGGGDGAGGGGAAGGGDTPASATGVSTPLVSDIESTFPASHIASDKGLDKLCLRGRNVNMDLIYEGFLWYSTDDITEWLAMMPVVVVVFIDLGQLW